MSRLKISARSTGLVCCCAALFGAAALAAGPSGKTPPKLVTGAQAPQAPAPTEPMPPLYTLPKAYQGTEAVLEQAKHAGVRSCYSSVDRLVHYLGANVNLGTQPFFTARGQDTDLVSMSMEMNNDSSLSYASVEVAPVLSASCAFAYDTVTYWPVPCDLLGPQAFPTMRSEGVLSSAIRVLADEGVPLMRVYLMPAGPGCVSIKKEVWF